MSKIRGTSFIISSPSGVGKTTVANFLLQSKLDITRSVSYTTRAPRGKEKDGIDYKFVKEDEFLRLVKEEKMLEHAKVFKDYYGTPIKSVEDKLESGLNVLFCIDWQGAVQIKSKMNAVSIFLLPPSFKELKRRLRSRNTDSHAAIEHRLKVAKEEISKYKLYDYALVNDDLEETKESVLSIVKSQKFRVCLQSKIIASKVNDLIKE